MATPVTRATRFRPYVFSPRGHYIHRVQAVEIYWYEHDGVRDPAPGVFATAVCGAHLKVGGRVPWAGPVYMVDEPDLRVLPLCPQCLAKLV